MITLTEASVSIDGTVLLAPVTLAVDRSEVLSVRGSNGSGKSTLLSLIAGVRPASSGTVEVAGAVPDDRSASFRRTVGGSLGEFTAAQDLTLREQLILVALTWNNQDPSGAADAELSAWEIAHLRDRYPHELSSGQRQLFTLALAWIRPAQVLLLDEPEQRLDAHRRGLLCERIVSRGAAGDTLVIATHSDDVESASTSVVWLSE